MGEEGEELSIGGEVEEVKLELGGPGWDKIYWKAAIEDQLKATASEAVEQSRTRVFVPQWQQEKTCNVTGAHNASQSTPK